MDVLFSVETDPKEKGQILENDFSIKMTQSIESEVSLMCNLSKGIEERGIEKGKQEERQRGIQAMVSALKDLNIAEDVILKKTAGKVWFKRRPGQEIYFMMERMHGSLFEGVICAGDRSGGEK